MVLKLKLLYQEGEKESGIYVTEDLFTDCWIDTRIIGGFVIPIDEDEQPMTDKVNLFFSDGEAQTFKAEQHLIDYLRACFVDVAKKCK